MAAVDRPGDGNNRSPQKQTISELAQQGDMQGAFELCSVLCEQSPGDPEAWFLLGAINGALENYPQAESCCRRAIELAPGHAMLRYNLAVALLKQGKATEAIVQLEQAIKLQPDLAGAYRELGNAHSMNDEPLLAVTDYRKSLELDPASASTLSNLGNVYRALGRLDEATDCYRKAISLQPDLVDAYAGLGSALVNQFKFDQAIDLLEEAVGRLADDSRLFHVLAVAYQEQGDADVSLKYYRKALAAEPDSVDDQVGVAGILALQGNYREAGEILEPLLASDPDNSSVKITYATFAHQFGATDKAREMSRRELEKDGTPNRNKAKFHFALAKLHERDGEYDTAFEHYAAGNRLREAHFDYASYERMFQALMDSYSRQAMQRLPRSGNISDSFIFIVGMPRSGTSLAEHILASHPEVFGAGELRNINYQVDRLPQTLNASVPYPFCLDRLTPEVLDRLAAQYQEDMIKRSGGKARYFVDKLPINFIHLGFISLLFPRAKFIHCTRDPIDTCLSCFFQMFAGELPYTYSLTDLGRFYRLYQKLMLHWKHVLPSPVYELNYERLVMEQASETRKLIEFCGLEWNDACLDFHKTSRTVATASYDQVRKPMYTKSIGRWRRYEKHLEPLLSALRIGT